MDMAVVLSSFGKYCSPLHLNKNNILMHESNSSALKSIIKLLYVVTLYSIYSIIR
jgi:hypothetical protein